MSVWEIIGVAGSITGILGFILYLIHLLSQKKDAQQVLDTTWRLAKIGAAVAVILVCVTALVILLGGWPKGSVSGSPGPDDLGAMKPSPAGDFTNSVGMTMKFLCGG